MESCRFAELVSFTSFKDLFGSKIAVAALLGFVHIIVSYIPPFEV